MMNTKKRMRQLAARLGKRTDCGVVNCGNSKDTELVWLKPFDPIDHDETPVVLCPKHQQWADERNAFAEKMTDELRECRKEIGQEHIERIQELSMPQDGKLREDILMGEPEEERIHLEDAFEGDSE